MFKAIGFYVNCFVFFISYLSNSAAFSKSLIIYGYAANGPIHPNAPALLTEETSFASVSKTIGAYIIGYLILSI